jgi:Uma2 family endonuclease
MAERTKLGMPLEEFIEKFDEQPFEMIAGEIIEMPPTKKLHGKVSCRIYNAFYKYQLENQNIEPFFEQAYVLEDFSDWVADSRVPDVMVFLKSRYDDYEKAMPSSDEKPFVLVPDLVVEVISPTDKYSNVSKKIDSYRKDGVKLLWVVDPQNGTITVYEAGKDTPLTLKKGDSLKGGEVLKGFEIGVSEVLGK